MAVSFIHLNTQLLHGAGDTEINRMRIHVFKQLVTQEEDRKY
jgi:hypothetical protein